MRKRINIMALRGMSYGALFFIFLASMATLSFASEISFIVNEKLGVERLPVETVKEIYLKEKEMWDSGASVVVFDQNDGAIPHQLLLKRVIQKSASEWESYWIQRKHARGEQEPQQLPSDAMMVRMVEAMDGAIGLVSSSFLNPKIIREHHLKVVATAEE